VASTPQRELDPEAICTRAVSRLIEEIRCVHIAPDSPVWQDLKSGETRVGELRVYRGRGVVEKVVSAHFKLKRPALESYMVTVFTRPESPVPHFVLDVVRFGSQASFQVDLLPKRDLGVSLPYMDRCFAPLSPIRADLEQDSRFATGTASLRKRALMSPWMALYTHAPEQLEVARSYVDRYFAHWSSLLTSGDALLSPDPALAARDAQQRKLVFSRDLDPMWATLDRALGVPTVDQLLAALS
jgi:hypothetical protein